MLCCLRYHNVYTYLAKEVNSYWMKKMLTVMLYCWLFATDVIHSAGSFRQWIVAALILLLRRGSFQLCSHQSVETLLFTVVFTVLHLPLLRKTVAPLLCWSQDLFCMVILKKSEYNQIKLCYSAWTCKCLFYYTYTCIVYQFDSWNYSRDYNSQIVSWSAFNLLSVSSVVLP